MKRFILILMALTLVVGCTEQSSAEPSPKGLEWVVDFPAGGNTPVSVRLAQKHRLGTIFAAQFTQVSASANIQVEVVDPNSEYLQPGEWVLGDYDAELGTRLRYTAGNPALGIGTPVKDLLIYGPVAGGSVTVNIWCEY